MYHQYFLPFGKPDRTDFFCGSSFEMTSEKRSIRACIMHIERKIHSMAFIGIRVVANGIGKIQRKPDNYHQRSRRKSLRENITTYTHNGDHLISKIFLASKIYDTSSISRVT